MAKHLSTGKAGEKLAADYLQEQQYEIITQNYRYKHYEIDLIAQKANLLIFVEVKTRRNINYGMPEAFVNSKKEINIRKAAEQYLYEANWQHNIRFDIIAITQLPNQPPEIVHLEDVFG
jgi:putative endonuclease